MPEAPITTTNRGYILVRKALNASETWDWFGEYVALWTQVDQDIQDLNDLITGGGGNVVSIGFDTTTGPTLTPEGTIWWNQEEYTINISTGLGATIQVGHEVLLLLYNATGSTIPNGTVVRPAGAITIGGHIYPTAGRARADRHENCEGTLCVSTHESLNGTLLLATRYGRVRDMDTTSFTPATPLWLSPTTAGEMTNTKPEFPFYSLQIGGAANSHATEGVVLVSITSSVTDIFHATTDGAFAETIDFLVTSDGATITGSLSCNYDPTRNLTMIFSDGLTTLSTYPAATVTLNAGTDDNPQQNYVYIPKTTKILTVSTSGWPTTEHIRIGCVCCQSAATTQADGGALKNQNWNDHLKKETENGHLLHLAYAMREKLGATWKSGCELTGSIVTNPAAPDDVYAATTGGVVMQLHDQTVDPLDMLGGDEVLVYNDSVTPFDRTSNLNTLLTDAAGVSMSTKAFSLVIWGAANKTGEPDKFFCNLPNSSYTIGPSDFAIEDAINDINGYAVYDMPQGMKSVGFLIARLTYRHTTTASGTWVLHDTEDLRGKISNISAGGAAGGTGVTTFLGLTDTASTYSGSADKVPVVNSGESALEFASFDDSAEIEWTASSAGISAALVSASVDETKLDASVNVSLDLADSAVQPTDTDYVDLTDSGDTTLHYHAADRDRANHTGIQPASTISDFHTEVSSNTDVAANTAARHAELHGPTHEDAGGDATNLANMSGTALVGSTGGVIGNGVFGSDQTVLGEVRDVESVVSRTITAMNAAPYSMEVTEKYLIVLEGSTGDYLRRYNRFNFELEDTVTGATWWGGNNMAANEDMVVIVFTDQVAEIDIVDFASYSYVTATGFDTGATGVALASDGTIYKIKSDNSFQVAVRGESDYTVSDYTLSGTSNDLYLPFLSPDELYFYIIDADGSNTYVRKYDVATRTLQYSSAVMSGSVNVSRRPYATDTYIYLQVTGQLVILNESDLSLVYRSGVTITATPNCVKDSIMYVAQTSSLSMSQVQSLTREDPDFVNSIGGGGIYSADGLPDVQWTKADTGRAVQYSHNPALMTGVASEGLPGLKVFNGEYGDDESVLGEFRDVEVLFSGESFSSSGLNFMTADLKYIWILDGTGQELFQVDRLSGALIDSIACTYYGPVASDGDRVVVCYNGGLAEFKTASFPNSPTLYTSTNPSSCNRFEYTGGKWYAISTAGVMTVFGSDLLIDGSTVSISGITEQITAFWTDGTDLFVIDCDPASAGSTYVREINISTGGLVQSSSAVATLSGSGYRNGLWNSSDRLFLIVNQTGALSKVMCLSKSDLSISWTGTNTFEALKTFNVNNVLYTTRYKSSVIYQNTYNIPSLTSVEPDFLDSRGGGGIYSADGLTDDAGNDIYWTKADTGRAVQYAHNPALMTGMASEGLPGLKVFNGEYGDDESVLGEFRPDTLLMSGDSITDTIGSCGLAVDKNFIFVNPNDTNLLYKFDRLTGTLLQTSTVGFPNRSLYAFDGFLFHFYANTQARIVNKSDVDTYTSLTFTGDTLPGVGYDMDYDADNQLLVSVSIATPTLSTVDPMTGVCVNIRTLTELTRPLNIRLSTDGTHVYIADRETTGELYVYKFLYSTGVLVTTSIELASDVSTAATMDIFGDYIVLSAFGSLIVMDADLNVVFSGSSSFDDLKMMKFGGTLYGVYESGTDIIIGAAQPPALTMIEPNYVDSRGGGGIYSADGLTGILWSKEDVGRTVVAIQPLILNQFGAIIQSVESAEPSSPTPGEYYLMASDATWNANMIAFYDVRGWHLYTPYHGAKIRDASGQYTYEYYQDRWIKNVDMRLFAAISGDGASTLTDLMTIDAGDTLTPLLESGEAWDVEITLMATVPDGTATGTQTTSKWVLSASIQQGPTGSIAGYINTSGTIASFTAVGTPHAGLETPEAVIVPVSSTGDLQITVGTNSGTSADWEFYATIKGVSQSGSAHAVA